MMKYLFVPSGGYLALSPENKVIISDNECDTFLFWNDCTKTLSDGKNDLVFFYAKREFYVEIKKNSSSRVEFLESQSYIKIYADGYYLSLESEESKDLIFSRNETENTKFLLLDASTKESIGLLLKNGFWSGNYNDFISFSEVNFRRGIISYRDISVEIKRNTSLDISTDKQLFIYNDANIDIIRIFNPLIYFCCFGEEKYLEMTNCLLNSLIKFGKIIPNIIILTDMREEIVFKYIKFYDKQKIKIINLYSPSKQGYCAERFNIEEFEVFSKYSPVLYLDNDIVINSDISEIFRDLFDIKGIACSSELGDAANNPVWFGETLKNQDGFLGHLPNPHINAGVYGFRRLSDVQNIFSNTLAVFGEITRRKGECVDSSDQSSFGYAVMKSENYDVEILPRYVKNWPSTKFDEIPRKGIAHFCGGVGEYAGKLALMESYVEYLSKQ